METKIIDDSYFIHNSGMNAEEITKCIGIPHLTLENFELADPDTRYILTSPRSLQACDLCGLRYVLKLLIIGW